MRQLCSDLGAKESILSQQEKRITEGFSERDRIITLQADAIKRLEAKESMLSQQEERIKEGFLERDRVITLQVNAIKKLESDMSSLSEKAAEQAQVHMHNIAQRDSLITEQPNRLKG